MDQVEVDILIPVREPAPWLPETLAGVRALTGVSFNVIVVVNGPDERTSLMVQASGLDVRMAFSPDSATLADTLNLGLSTCTAPLVARLDADDIPRPSRLEVQRAVLELYPEAAMVCSGKTFIDESGRPIGVAHPPRSADALARAMRWKNVVWHPTVMYRREVVMTLGGYSARAQFVEDYELWLRMLASHAILPIDEPLLSYRIHANQITRAKVIPSEAMDAILRAKIALAKARGESVVAARARHLAWAARQVPRRIFR
jgi:glycosyltransferase involved in cell wall biosynthesis